ncbi:MAG: hypothetical protein ACE5NG_12235, partial [bacterium]
MGYSYPEESLIQIRIFKASLEELKLQNLTEEQFRQLIHKVFALQSKDHTLLVIVDVPNDLVPDTEIWKDRRVLANEWKEILQKTKAELGLQGVEIIYYENVGSNNADLPVKAYQWQGDPRAVDISLLVSEGSSLGFEELLSRADIILAPTQFSATAPLKVLAKKHNFRAATMPGFSRAMIPALGIDYEKVHEQVMKIKSRLDEAVGIELNFKVKNLDYHLFVDLRHRQAHASSGLLREAGVAGNLPSGEAYIVPYEGELAEESKTAGPLPVHFGDEVVVYKI